MSIALDAGHGARPGRANTGAAANGLIEDEIALDMVKRIGHHLRAAGHQTIITRPNKDMVSLNRRAWLARFHRCDLFLSVHCNAGPVSASGVEEFVVRNDKRSYAIARGIIKPIVGLGLCSRGVKWDDQGQHPRLAVLRGTYLQMPAVLLELGFLTNAKDAALLRDRKWRERAAIAVADAVSRSAAVS